MSSWRILQKDPTAVKYAVSLLKQYREELGFIPIAAFEKYNEEGNLRLALLNNEPCGYLLHSKPSFYRDTTIFQACIQYDVRRRTYGALLVESLVKDSTTVKASGLWCKCSFELESNLFWESIGWYCSGQIRGGVKRARLLNIYRLDLLPSLTVIQAKAVVGVKSQTIYERQRRTGKLLLPFGYTNAYGVPTKVVVHEGGEA